MSRPRASDERILEALVQGKTHAEAARIAGVSVRTVSRRLEDPGFEARVAAAKTERFAVHAAQIGGLVGKAIRTAGELLDDPDPRMRLGAVQIVVKTAIVFREQSELEDRLRALETGQDPAKFRVVET